MYAAMAMPSLPPYSARHVCEQHPEAAQQQDAACRQREAGIQRYGHRGQRNNRNDLDRQRAVVNEQADELAQDKSQCAHGSTSAPVWRTRPTAARPAARNNAANSMI